MPVRSLLRRNSSVTEKDQSRWGGSSQFSPGKGTRLPSVVPPVSDLEVRPPLLPFWARTPCCCVSVGPRLGGVGVSAVVGGRTGKTCSGRLTHLVYVWSPRRRRSLPRAFTLTTSFPLRVNKFKTMYKWVNERFLTSSTRRVVVILMFKDKATWEGLYRPKKICSKWFACPFSAVGP